MVTRLAGEETKIFHHGGHRQSVVAEAAAGRNDKGVVANKVETKVKGSGQECPLHTSQDLLRKF